MSYADIKYLSIPINILELIRKTDQEDLIGIGQHGSNGNSYMVRTSEKCITLVTPNVSYTFPNISYFVKIMFGNVCYTYHTNLLSNIQTLILSNIQTFITPIPNLYKHL